MKSKDRIMRLAMSVTSVFVLTMVLALLVPLPLGTRTAAGYEPARAQMIGPSDRGPTGSCPTPHSSCIFRCCSSLQAV